MDEQLLPIGIDSEVKHVSDELDRIDGMFTVATGPMGHQEINYHIIHNEPKSLLNKKSFSQTKSISKFASKKSSLNIKSSLSSNQEKVESSNPDDEHLLRYIADDDYDRTPRFSLPEVDFYNPWRNQDHLKRCKRHDGCSHLKCYFCFRFPSYALDNNSLKLIEKERSIFDLANTINNTTAQNLTLSSSFSSHESMVEIPVHCRPATINQLQQQQQQQLEALLPFYTFNELAEHNDSTDAWICIFTYIYDITSLVEKTKGTKVYQLLVEYAGSDISLWFDQQSNEPRRRIDPNTHESVLLKQELSIIETFGTPFWQTKDLLIGRLIERPRYIRLMHSYSPKQAYLLEVAEDETVGQIAKTFLKYNSHIFSYTWLYDGRRLDFSKTLTENGIPNEEIFHDTYGWRSDNENCPTILLYYSDDLTIA